MAGLSDCTVRLRRHPLEPEEVADVASVMLTLPCGMTIRDVVTMPTNFDL